MKKDTKMTSIMANQGLWQELVKLSGNLSIKQKKLEVALLEAYELASPSWEKLTTEELNSWNVECAKRVRAQGRVIMQQKQKRPTSWAHVVFKSGPVEAEACSVPLVLPDATAPCAASDAPASYMYGFNPEHRMAWRATPEQPQKLEYAMKLVYPKPCQYDEPMVVVFKDSTRAAITAITVDEYKSMALVKDLAARGPLWKAAGQDGETITITMKKGRKQLMLIKVSGKQCLQIAMEKFHTQVGDNMRDDMELKATALSFMQGIAEQYRDGKIGIEQLGSTRDAKLRPGGLYVEANNKNNKSDKRGTDELAHASSKQAKARRGRNYVAHAEVDGGVAGHATHGPACRSGAGA